MREGVDRPRGLARRATASSGRTLPLIRERVAADLVRALERVRPGRRGRAGAAGRRAAGGDARRGAARRRAAAADEDVSPQAAGDVTRARADGVPSPACRRRVGPSLLTRSLGFNVASAPGYSGGTVAGIRAEGAVFPLALSAELAAEHPVLASFGLRGSYEYVFSFSSATATGSSRGHASRWDVVFVGRVPLGHGAQAAACSCSTRGCSR